MYQQTLTQAELTHAFSTYPEFEECVFNNCDFTTISLRGVRFENCQFVACNLSNCDLTGTAFQQAAFVECKLMGLDWERINGLGFTASFERCSLSHSFIVNGNWKKTVFTNCILEGVHLERCNLQQTQWIDCRFSNARFIDNNLEGAVFTQPTDLVLSPSENRLKKAKFPLKALPGLLEEYGIIVT